MVSSGFSFGTGDSDTIQDGFLDCSGSNVLWEDFLDVKPTVVVSPDQFLIPLPDPDPGYPWPQPSSPIENVEVAPPGPNAHTYFDAHDWPSQLDIQSSQYHPTVFNPQDSELMPAVMPTTHPSSAILNAGRSSMSQGYQPDIQSAQYHPPAFNPQDSELMPAVIPTSHRPSAIFNAGRPLVSQGYPAAVVNGTTPVHDVTYSPQNRFSPPGSTVPSYHNNSPMFVDQAELLNSEIGTLSPSSTPPESAFQPTVPRCPIERTQHQNSRRGSSITNYSYPPTRMSSLPVQASPPEEAVSHTCQWMVADGTMCGTPITWAGVPKHLTTHGVENMANHFRVPCRWLGCRIKGNHNMLNRESIVRHVREKHLGYRRSL